MKQFKTFCTKALMFFISVVSALIFITILVQVISLSFYTALLLTAIASLGYIFKRCL